MSNIFTMEKRGPRSLLPSMMLLVGFQSTSWAADLLPLWETYRGSPTNDTFYTVDYGKYLNSRSSGALDHGVAAWLPCAPSGTPGPQGEAPQASAITLEGNFGYPLSLPMAFACARPAGTLPLYRFYKGSPQTTHAFAVSQTEIDTVYGAGFQFERVEGYVYTSQAAGRVPLYALSGMTGCFPSGCELELRYTTSADSRQTLLNAGWGGGNPIGYVFDAYVNSPVSSQFTGNINKTVGTLPNYSSVPLTNVSPPTGISALKGNRIANAFYGMMAVNSTARPVGAYKQKITFTLNTGTLFDEASAIDHLPIILYAHSGFGSTGMPSVPYDGMGIFLAKPNWGRPGRCDGQPANLPTSGAQVFVEEFAMGKRVDCTAGLAVPLERVKYYKFEITVADNAVLTYKITDTATNVVIKNFSKSYAADFACPTSHTPGSLPVHMVYCNNPFTTDRFANHRTGYNITPISDSLSYSSIYSGLTVQWLSQNGTVLSTL